MVITEKTILKDYNKLKQLANKYYSKRKFELSSIYIKKASMLMNQSNLFYYDSDLEDLLKRIAQKIIDPSKEIHTRNEKIKVLFYDFFVLDNRGLSEQYLNALFDKEKYVLSYIGCNPKEDESIIYTKLKEKNIPYSIIADQKEIQKARMIYENILSFSPDVIIAHTSPWDIAGLLAISLFENRCARYLINITDHEFWLGTTVFDYFFEFRDYGFNISKLFRNIDEKKLLKLPYYPVINKNIPFQGFDFNYSNKKLIFSGGRICKIEGSPVFFELVKHILSKHPDTIFLYLGIGNKKYLENFIEENNFQDRFFFRNERKDIFEVFKNCYFFLNTYPLSGSLMTQYACMAGKLPLTYRDADNPESNLNELFINNSNSVEIQFSELESLKSKIDYYLNNPCELEKDEKKLKDKIIPEEQFNSLLYDYLRGSQNKINSITYEINHTKIKNQYIHNFNENNLSYYFLFIKNLYTPVFYFFKYYILFILIQIKKKIDKYIMN